MTTHSTAVATALCLALTCGCAGSNTKLKGAVQKGPFVIGSTVTASVLDDALVATGQTFTTATSNDRGEFELTAPSGRPLNLEGVGYYYNEATGALSKSTLTLRALFVPGAEAETVFVNLATHLTAQRIRTLVESGTAFPAAVTQAEGELLAELAITKAGWRPASASTTMNVAGGDTDENAYLLAMSVMVIYAAGGWQDGSVDAHVQEFINKFALDFADGALQADIKAQLTAAKPYLDLAAVTAALRARLAATGSSEEPPDMSRVFDQDGDGLANADDDCPLAADPGQEDGDQDGVGSACDICPSLACDFDCGPQSAGWPADQCIRYCSSETPCGADEICGEVFGDLYALVCLPVCDPFGAACAQGTTCLLDNAWGRGEGHTYAKQWQCQVATGLPGLGATCWIPPNEQSSPQPVPCAAGLVCLDNDSSCHRACQVASPSCPEGESCQAIAGAADTSIGVCR